MRQVRCVAMGFPLRLRIVNKRALLKGEAFCGTMAAAHWTLVELMFTPLNITVKLSIRHLTDCGQIGFGVKLLSINHPWVP
jgi:hypothetical protein